jgi:hypothetical protein
MLQYEKAYRQGEILIFKVKSLKNISPWELKSSGLKPMIVKSGVIREGEKEGHEHKLKGQAQLTLFGDDPKFADTGAIKVEGRTKLTHPEHDPINLPKGEYVVKIQKEAVGKNKHQSVRD